MSSPWSHRFETIPNLPYGNDPAQRLDVYAQLEPSAKPQWWSRSKELRPTYIFIHGGGWMGGDKESAMNMFLQALEEGYNVVNVEYRLGCGTAPAACEDVMAVLAWIEKNAEEYRLDPQRLILGGGSAGGHLALLAAALHSSKPELGVAIKGVVNWFGVADLAGMQDHLKKNFGSEEQFLSQWCEGQTDPEAFFKKWSPLSYITPAMPPVLTIHGTQDATVPFDQAAILDEQMHKVDVLHRVLSLEEGDHGAFSDSQWMEAFDAASDFMEVVVSGP